MNTKSALTWTGACLMAAAAIWAFIAVRLSAYEVITVLAELVSYWLALCVVIGGAWLFLKGRHKPVSSSSFLARCLCVAIAFTVLVASWGLSSRRFILLKVRSIPQNAWSKMVSDLEGIGTHAAQSGVTSVSSQTPLPKSLQQLGLASEYSGGMGNVWKASEYTGPVASVLFGYKSRSWGLCVGPESFASRCARKGNYIHVASNAYFFCGPRY
jgi:hypothetical protein